MASSSSISVLSSSSWNRTGRKIFAQQEFGVLKSKPVRLALRLRGGKLLFGEVRFLLSFVEAAVCYFVSFISLRLGGPLLLLPPLIGNNSIYHRFVRFCHVEVEMIGMCGVIVRAQHRAEALAGRLVHPGAKIRAPPAWPFQPSSTDIRRPFCRTNADTSTALA